MMRLRPTPEQRAFGRAVGDLLGAHATPEQVRDTTDGFDAGRWARLADTGLFGVLLAEEHGGLGGDETDLLAPLEAAGRVALPEPVTEAIVAAGLLADAGGDVAAAHLPGLAAGSEVITAGVPRPGADRARYVNAAERAGLMLLTHADGWYAVPRDAVTRTAQPSIDPARRLSTVSWEPGDATPLADGVRAAEMTARAQARGAVLNAAYLLGVCHRLIELTSEYTRQRHQFGRPIGSFQAVKHQLADALVATEFAGPPVRRAAATLASGAATRDRDAAMAGAMATRAAELTADVALQLHGAIGYTYEADLHLWLRRAWSLAAAWGDAATQEHRVAAALIDDARTDRLP